MKFGSEWGRIPLLKARIHTRVRDSQVSSRTSGKRVRERSLNAFANGNEDEFGSEWGRRPLLRRPSEECEGGIQTSRTNEEASKFGS